MTSRTSHNKIQKLEERLVYSNPWIKLFFDHVRFPDGREGYYNRIIESEGRHGVAVLPFRRQSIGLVRQFRYPIGQELWEIPRGFGDSNDSRHDALRELEEETGIKIELERLVELGPIYPNSGILASQVLLFAADCEDVPELPKSPKGHEITEFRWIQKEEVLSGIASGEITDAFTLCAVLRARELGII
ncbi:MAG: NUDIX hydrolase [Candidatus Bathyarchaeia archaeon]